MGAPGEDGADLLRCLGDALGLAAYACDAAGRVEVAGEALAALLGRSAADLLREPLDVHCAAEDRERVRAARAGAAVGATLELEYRLASGVPVRDVARVCLTAGGPRLVGALEDGRARRRRELQAAEAARAEAQASLAAGVAHEVNNALAGVLNYARLAERCTPGDAHLAEALAGVLSEGLRIGDMMRALVTYAGSGARHLRVADLVNAALTPLRRELREELISPAVALGDDLPTVEAIGHELQVALRYALSWARAALVARGPGRKTLAVRGTWSEAADAVVIAIEDAAGGPRRAAAGDLQAQVEEERCRELLAHHRGRLEVVGDAAHLVLPL